MGCGFCAAEFSHTSSFRAAVCSTGFLYLWHIHSHPLHHSFNVRKIAMSTTLLPPRRSTDAKKIACEIREQHRLSNVAKAELLELIAHFDEHELSEALGASSTVDWLQRELRYPVSTAYEYVRIGRKLQDFPLLAAAFRRAELDYTTVRFLLPYMTEINEADLVELGRTLCHAELRQALAGAPSDDDKDPDEPYFEIDTRSSGMMEGRFLIPAILGELLKSALKIAQLANYDFKGDDIEAQLAADVISTMEKELREMYGDALVDACDPQPTAEEECAILPPEIDEACPSEQVSAPRPDTKITMEKLLQVPTRFGAVANVDLYNAFVNMIQMVRANPTTPVRAPGANVTIMLTEDGKAWMPQNPQIPSPVVRDYVADAMYRMHISDPAGITLSYGRERRFASDAQIGALLAVWGHQCAMPGCTHTRFIEIHHITEWAEGGRTDMDNLIPLCSTCHSKVSHGLAHITQVGPDLEFRFKDGSRFISRNRGLPERADDFDGPMREYDFISGQSFE